MLDPRGVNRTNKVARWTRVFFALVAALARCHSSVDRAQDRLHAGPVKELRARLLHRQQHLPRHCCVSGLMGVVRESFGRAYLGAVGVARCGVAAAAVLGRLVAALRGHLHKTRATSGCTTRKKKARAERTIESAAVNSS